MIPCFLIYNRYYILRNLLDTSTIVPLALTMEIVEVRLSYEKSDWVRFVTTVYQCYLVVNRQTRCSSNYKLKWQIFVLYFQVITNPV
jgi:hypothetical protein